MTIVQHAGNGEPEAKRCSKCGELWPIERYRFRNREAGKRHGECRTCNALYLRQKRAKQKGRRLRQFVSDVHRHRNDGLGKLIALVESMVEQFGGLRRLVEAWHEHYEAARARGEYHRAWHNTRAIVELMAANTPTVKAAREQEMKLMTKEELEQSFQLEGARCLLGLIGRCDLDDDLRETVRHAVAEQGRREGLFQ